MQGKFSLRSDLMKKIFFFLLISNISFAQPELKYKIAQMLMVGFPGKTVSDTILINDLQSRGVGGVILFSGNIESPSQLNQLTTQLQNSSLFPLFISIDQEGGKVARLKESNGYANTFTPYQIGTIFNDEVITRDWAGLMAGWLDDANININLAPVADVNINPESPAIGHLDRSFSRIPDTVFQHCSWFIDEFHQRNLFNTLKHFPGHGSAETDSHLGFTDITNTWADSELIPFQKLIENGYNDFIMSGHLFNANLDSVYPASLSSNIIEGLLRDSLAFEGLIITDGMFMGAISNNYSFDEAVTLAIKAGNDILLYTSNKIEGKSLVDSVVNIVIGKISAGVITEDRINQSYNRIIQKKAGLTDLRYFTGEFLPEEFGLVNYPNPFNSTTKIRFKINQPGNVSIKVYSLIGEEVEEIINSYYQTGTHTIHFSGDELSSGVYLLFMKTTEGYSSHKIILLK